MKRADSEEPAPEISGKKEFLAECTMGVTATFVAVGVGALLFGDRYSSSEFWRETITTSVGLILAAAVAIPVMRWQRRRKASRESAGESAGRPSAADESGSSPEDTPKLDEAEPSPSTAQPHEEALSHADAPAVD